MFRNFINFKVLHGIRTFSKLVEKKEKNPTKKTLGSLEHSRDQKCYHASHPNIIKHRLKSKMWIIFCPLTFLPASLAARMHIVLS